MSLLRRASRSAAIAALVAFDPFQKELESWQSSSQNSEGFVIDIAPTSTYIAQISNTFTKFCEAIMPQLHFYVPEQVADRVRQEANAAGLSVSRYLAAVVKRELHPEWPADFFEEVVGGWQGEPLQRAEQGTHDVREAILLGES